MCCVDRLRWQLLAAENGQSIQTLIRLLTRSVALALNGLDQFRCYHLEGLYLTEGD
jgi:hypothetical protein